MPEEPPFSRPEPKRRASGVLDATFRWQGMFARFFEQPPDYLIFQKKQKAATLQTFYQKHNYYRRHGGSVAFCIEFPKLYKFFSLLDYFLIKNLKRFTQVVIMT